MWTIVYLENEQTVPGADLQKVKFNNFIFIQILCPQGQNSDNLNMVTSKTRERALR